MPLLPSPSQPPVRKIPHPPDPKPKPNRRRSGPPSKSRVSASLHRMSDLAAAGTIVPAGGGGSGWAWPNGGPRFGDMVWGKVKSHPWWPGHVYSITLTDNAEVHRGHRDGLILVAFFGDSSYGWFEPHEIVPFEEHFAEKVAQGASTRSSFAAAVAEAVDEVARRAALGLFCPCRKPGAFRPHPLDARYLLVDVPGFDTDADYHPDQIAASRDRFVPRKALDFLLDAAVTQRDAADAAARTLPGMEMAGMLAAYRRTTFVPYDETYSQAFGVSPEKARAAEEKAAAERAQRGINTFMLNRSSCAIDCCYCCCYVPELVGQRVIL
jgi:DNA (cytosine-5)-methyltransferase 3A